MIVANHEHDDEVATSHYRTAGHALILLGVINCAVAGYSLISGLDSPFIGFDMMLLFGLSFVAVGVWMKTYNVSQ